MGYQVLARKWRPHNFEQMVGQQHVIKALANALDRNQLHHAYLLTGTRGVGKTTLARIFAKALNCETGLTSKPCGQCSACLDIDAGTFIDLLEVDAASRTGVEQTRELLDNVPYAATRGRFKVYLIDEVHMFSESSFNALLKTLEEPPAHVKFLLATTDPQKMPITVLSRCLQLNLKVLTRNEIQDQLKVITQAENINTEDKALHYLAQGADGSMRDGLSLLDQAIAYGAGNITESDVLLMLGGVQPDRILVLLEALASQQPEQLLEQINQMAETAPDFSAILGELIVLLQQIAIAQSVPKSLKNELEQDRLMALSKQISPEDIQLYYQIALLGQRDLLLTPDPKGGLEMTLLRMLTFRPDSPQWQPPPQPKITNTIVEPVQPPPEKVTTTPTNWANIVAQLPLVGMSMELAKNCICKSWTDHFIQLEIDFCFSVLVIPNAKEALQKALSDYSGYEVKLEIRYLSQAEAPLNTPAQQIKNNEQAEQKQAVEEMKQDPIVKALTDTFNGEVVEQTIKAVKKPIKS